MALSCLKATRGFPLFRNAYRLLRLGAVHKGIVRKIGLAVESNCSNLATNRIALA